MHPTKKNLIMNIILWVAQGILSALFLMGGVMKSFQPKEKLAKSMPWVNDFPSAVVKLIGVAELLGALALIGPMLFGITPVLTPLAAAGLGITMILAAVYHYRKHEMKEIVINTVLFSLAVFVALGRF